MSLIMCAKGHYFDDKKFFQCPYCGVVFKSGKNVIGENADSIATSSMDEATDDRTVLLSGEEGDKTVFLFDTEEDDRTVLVAEEDDDKTVLLLDSDGSTIFRPEEGCNKS